jgi:diguanylate cyclase (GGDEF)-like protein
VNHRAGLDRDAVFRSRAVQILAIETAIELAFFAAFVDFRPDLLRLVIGVLSLAAVVVAVLARRFRTASHRPGRFLILLAIVSIGCGAFVVTSSSIAVVAAFSLLGLSLSAIALDEDRPGILIGAISSAFALAVIFVRGDTPIASGIIYIGLAVTGTFLIIRLRRSLTAARDEAEHLAQTDPLTGLLNRRGMEVQVTSLNAVVSRAGLVLGCLVLDLDHFKAINDTHGHRAGDEVIVRSARVLTAATRDGDIVARTGGEEFVVFAALATAADLELLAERIRAEMAAQPEPTVTVSIGAATGPAQTAEQRSALFDRTDEALYAAKHAGRNTVRTR